MGNCQAIDAATLVIQHPNGKVEKLYWPVSASEVMKTNPGHYVALLISTTLCPLKTNEHVANHERPNNNENNHNNNNNKNNSVRLTRIKLLRPTDTLVLGQAYRLITSQEVMKGLWAKKQAKLKKNHPEGEKPLERQREKPGSGPVIATRGSELLEKDNQVIIKHERHRPRTTTATPSATARSRTWQPSLKSISEAGI
ncbi:uncharacterized protein LOC107418447 [Ziziphus jujuba]|uniref:Uncharacterized protein LOC107418447 n=2 Tax=Ziziphus jujuba TaxID=326968 RepID=A0A6P3ZS50_ZIZJJ|nr:uncharacterized protein LOC107418447 [Ziziphus jujuba]KAH7528509.1 hypothetical protein FEM48_Zijuj05G0079600 [Ziziphus jujuba var. spinosa]